MITDLELEPLYRQQAQKLKHTQTSLHRYLFNQINWKDRLIGIKGPRGTGKTTLLLQHIKEHFDNRDTLMYLSLDDLWFSNHDIIETIEYLYSYGVRYLFLDEIHHYMNWQMLIKNLYDTYKELHIVFTGSSMLEIKDGEGDLSRRAIIYELRGLSFREYLAFENIIQIDSYTLEDLISKHEIIAENICSKIQILPTFDNYLKYGYYPFYNEVYNGYWERVKATANTVINIDYPKINSVHLDTLNKMKKILMVLASRVPQVPNMNKLYQELETDRNHGLKMIYALQDGGLLSLLTNKAKNLKNLSTPDKIYLNNTTLMYALSTSVDIGTARETFFFNQMSKDHEVTYPKCGDFLIDDIYHFEVGGKNKTFEQIKDIPNSFLAVDNIEIGRKNRIPLWMFGLLY